MNVRQHTEQATVLQRTRQQPGIHKTGLHRRRESLAAERDKVEHLAQHRGCRARKVQTKRVLNRAKIVQLKHQVTRHKLRRTEDDPADTRIHETKLVARRIDRGHTRDIKAPFVVRRRKRRHHRTRRTINVDRYVQARPLLQLIELMSHFLHWLIVARVRRTENHDDSNRVLVNVVHRTLRIKAVVRRLVHRHGTLLNLPVARKLFHAHLHVRTKHQIRAWVVDILALRLALLLPAALGTKQSKHDGLR